MGENRNKVVDILKDYYGEDRVDDQGSFILIYWPEVTVTNENDRSVVIKELYAKVKVNQDGKLEGTFNLNRAEYSCTEWYNDYMHSHVCHISKSNPGYFSTSCLGHGPIRDTMTYLNTNFDEEFWTMFALELDKYVHTESLEGGPFHKFETINRLPETSIDEKTLIIHSSPNYTDFIRQGMLNDILNRFIPYVISKRPFGFSFNDRYYVADSDYNIVIKLSNLFIEWFNSIQDDSEKLSIKNYMTSRKYIDSYKAYGGVIKALVVKRHDYGQYRRVNGASLWTFKGRRLSLKITGIPEDEITVGVNDPFLSTLLKPELALYIVNKILNVINYQYGKTEIQCAGIDKKTYYLSTYNTNRGRTEDTPPVF